MDNAINTPKYLTQEVIAAALKAAEAAFFESPAMAALVQKTFCAVAIVVPARVGDRLVPHLLLADYIGEGCVGPMYDYIGFAKSKALQLWEGRNDDRTDVRPHLLMPGDAPLWGGVMRDSIAVACSALPPHLDKACASVISDLLVGLAYEAFLRDKEVAEEHRRCFLK